MEQIPKTSNAEFVIRIRRALGLMPNDSDEDNIQLRYVMYVRKSTDRSEKQERSIPDQIHECRELQKKNGLIVVDIIHEEKSAKDSGNRPKFREMVNHIVAGKYDAILAWAPDRLARNMKEAGELIDLLDRGDIKDIKFSNGYYFNNDAAGKMMLGIAFVQAKQFIDAHSQNVKRSVNRITQEGKFYDKPKHGYYKDKNGYPKPDGENWELIAQAFEMRLSSNPNYTLKEIGKWLEEKGYPLKTKHNKKKRVNITVSLLSRIFRDPFYVGVLIFGDQVIDLMEITKFKPIITPEQFDRIVELHGLSKKFKLANLIKSKEGIKADLMRDMVICDHCGKTFSTGITSKKNQKGEVKNYFYYRCDTKGCQFKGKSVRAKVIMDAAYQFLDDHPMNMKRGYDAYKREIKRLSAKRDIDLSSREKALIQQRRGVKNRISDLKDQILSSESDKVLKMVFKEDLKEKIDELKNINGEVKELKEQKSLTNHSIQSYQEFIELFGNLANVIKEINRMDDLDFIMRKVFMNFYIKDGKVAKITQNSPFRELCNSDDSLMVTPRGIEPRFPG